MLIACLEQQQQQRLVADAGDAESNDNSPVDSDLDSAVLVTRFGFDVGSDPSPAVSDFGGLVHGSPPAAFIRPSTAEDVSLAVRIASRSLLTVAARGNGHSINGQAMADAGGLVLDMRSLCAQEPMRLIYLDGAENAAADVSGGALWEEVLEWSVRCHGLAPSSWTDYLRLTVGGTLSVGGISGQAFRWGPQLSNVTELEVVRGDGERHVCSPSTLPDLFFAVLGGLGQFGIITRARIPLVPAPRMVKWIRLVYGRFEDYAADAESLVTRSSADSGEATSFDYLEGFIFVNDPADQVNGWGSVPLSPGSSIDPERIPVGAGSVLYCLELGLDYSHADDVDKRAEEMMKPLRYIRGLEFAADVSYVEFLSRVGQAEAEARANGSWSRPHPWLNILVSSQDIADFDRDVFKRILRRGIGGPMLVYPLLKSKWDCRTSMAVPDGEVFYLVALLRMISAEDDDSATAAAEAAVAQNREIIECCRRNHYDFKLYIPHYETEEEWAEHFGRDWTRFVQRKRQYDPMAVLAPGQRIFSRRPPV